MSLVAAHSSVATTTTTTTVNSRASAVAALTSSATADVTASSETSIDPFYSSTTDVTPAAPSRRATLLSEELAETLVNLTMSPNSPIKDKKLFLQSVQELLNSSQNNLVMVEEDEEGDSGSSTGNSSDEEETVSHDDEEEEKDEEEIDDDESRAEEEIRGHYLENNNLQSQSDSNVNAMSPRVPTNSSSSSRGTAASPSSSSPTASQFAPRKRAFMTSLRDFLGDNSELLQHDQGLRDLYREVSSIVESMAEKKTVATVSTKSTTGTHSVTHMNTANAAATAISSPVCYHNKQYPPPIPPPLNVSAHSIQLAGHGSDDYKRTEFPLLGAFSDLMNSKQHEMLSSSSSLQKPQSRASGTFQPDLCGYPTSPHQNRKNLNHCVSNHNNSNSNILSSASQSPVGEMREQCVIDGVAIYSSPKVRNMLRLNQDFSSSSETEDELSPMVYRSLQELKEDETDEYYDDVGDDELVTDTDEDSDINTCLSSVCISRAREKKRGQEYSEQRSGMEKTYEEARKRSGGVLPVIMKPANRKLIPVSPIQQDILVMPLVQPMRRGSAIEDIHFDPQLLDCSQPTKIITKNENTESTCVEDSGPCRDRPKKIMVESMRRSSLMERSTENAAVDSPNRKSKMPLVQPMRRSSVVETKIPMESPQPLLSESTEQAHVAPFTIEKPPSVDSPSQERRRKTCNVVLSSSRTGKQRRAVQSEASVSKEKKLERRKTENELEQTPGESKPKINKSVFSSSHISSPQTPTSQQSRKRCSSREHRHKVSSLSAHISSLVDVGVADDIMSLPAISSTKKHHRRSHSVGDGIKNKAKSHKRLHSSAHVSAGAIKDRSHPTRRRLHSSAHATSCSAESSDNAQSRSRSKTKRSSGTSGGHESAPQTLKIKKNDSGTKETVKTSEREKMNESRSKSQARPRSHSTGQVREQRSSSTSKRRSNSNSRRQEQDGVVASTAISRAYKDRREGATADKPTSSSCTAKRCSSAKRSSSRSCREHSEYRRKTPSRSRQKTPSKSRRSQSSSTRTRLTSKVEDASGASLPSSSRGGSQGAKSRSSSRRPPGQDKGSSAKTSPPSSASSSLLVSKLKTHRIPTSPQSTKSGKKQSLRKSKLGIRLRKIEKKDDDELNESAHSRKSAMTTLTAFLGRTSDKSSSIGGGRSEEGSICPSVAQTICLGTRTTIEDPAPRRPQRRCSTGPVLPTRRMSALQPGVGDLSERSRVCDGSTHVDNNNTAKEGDRNRCRSGHSSVHGGSAHTNDITNDKARSGGRDHSRSEQRSAYDGSAHTNSTNNKAGGSNSRHTLSTHKTSTSSISQSNSSRSTSDDATALRPSSKKVEKTREHSSGDKRHHRNTSSTATSKHSSSSTRRHQQERRQKFTEPSVER